VCSLAFRVSGPPGQDWGGGRGSNLHQNLPWTGGDVCAKSHQDCGFGFPLVLHIPTGKQTDRQTNVCRFFYICRRRYIEFTSFLTQTFTSSFKASLFSKNMVSFQKVGNYIDKAEWSWSKQESKPNASWSKGLETKSFKPDIYFLNPFEPWAYPSCKNWYLKNYVIPDQKLWSKSWLPFWCD